MYVQYGRRLTPTGTDDNRYSAYRWDTEAANNNITHTDH